MPLEIRMKTRFWLYLGLLGFSFLIAITNLYLGQHEIGAYDLSSIIDAGWRLFAGQVPSRDFICTLPPSLYLFTEWAFRIFGVHWTSIFWAQSILYVLLVVLGLRLCWILGLVSSPHSGLLVPAIYIAAQSAPTLSVNHLYHSTTASTFAAYSLLAAFVLCQKLSPLQHREVICHLTAGFAVLLLSKPNTAWFAILICAVCLCRQSRLRIPVLICFVSAIAVDACVLSICHVGDFNAFAGYAGLSGRAVPKMFLAGIVPDPSPQGTISVFLTYLALCIPLFWMAILTIRERLRIWTSSSDLLCLGAAAVSFVGFGTNWDLKISDVAPILVGMALFAMAGPERQRRLVVPMQGASVLLIFVACWLGFGRVRMELAGDWAGPLWGEKAEIHDAFFGDFITRQGFKIVLNEVDTVVDQSHGKRIFFGPRMEFLYAREGITSPTHLPVWWHPGSSYSLSAEPDVVKAWEEHHFDVLIFPKYDRTRIPSGIIDKLNTEYAYDGSRRLVDVFYRK